MEVENQGRTLAGSRVDSSDSKKEERTEKAIGIKLWFLFVLGMVKGCTFNI